jgi:Protein of unknown function (DUF1344)
VPIPKEALNMKRILVVDLAVVFAGPLAVSADEVTGRIQSIDRPGHSFVLDDGSRLSLDEGRLADVIEGETVRATFVTQDGKKVVTEYERLTGMDKADMSNFGVQSD